MRYGSILYLILKELDSTSPLDDTIVSLKSENSSSSSASGNSVSESEDEVANLSSEKERLKQELKKTKDFLADSKRNLTLANNLRVAHRDEIQDLKAKLEVKCKETAVLLKRNTVLQDLLTKNISGEVK